MTTAPFDASIAMCHDCGAGPLHLAAGYSAFHRVTSDCKPWPPGGQLGMCEACGLVQAVTDAIWERESREIYSHYEIYHQSQGMEQTVFNPSTGQGQSRSSAILEKLLSAAQLPLQGRLLDIGCGNGAFLRECSRALPGWQLCGSEFDQRHRTIVEAIPGVEQFYSSPLPEIPGTFDLISMIHVLEHLRGPTGFLAQLLSKLRPGGQVLVEVPDCQINPFMLLVADHATHFSAASLQQRARGAGFQVRYAGCGWVPKEISMLATATDEPTPARHAGDAVAGLQVFQNTEFLAAIVEKARALQTRQAYGILGTSIAGTWLDTQTGRSCSFFLDEDPHRRHQVHAGRPILAPEDVPAGAAVFVALPGALAKRVAERLHSHRPDLEFVTP